ncbi:MAG: hypothetical protein AAFW87_10010 [Pseudomonadota bacterium]
MGALRRVWLLAAVPLSACLADGGGFGLRDQSSRNAVQAIPLYGGDVVVRGPRGYCVDGDSVRRQNGNQLVLLASCESLTGQRGTAVEPALFVVNVKPTRAGIVPPKALGIAASMAPQKTLQAIDGDGLALVRLQAPSNPALPGSDPRYWRAGMVINNHFVSLAVYGKLGSPVAGKLGKTLILDLAESLRAASPVKRYIPAPPANTGPTEADAPAAVTRSAPLGAKVAF